MILRTVPQPVLLHHLRSTRLSANEVDFIYSAALCLACLGGALHGAAMALRKSGGDGKVHYYLQWKWWAGTITDGFAGAMIWPAMPLVSVQILVPLIIVVQLGASYISGLLFFDEKCSLRNNLGLSLSTIGIIGVSLSTKPEAAEFTMHEFESRWVSMTFLLTNAAVLLIIAGSFATMHRSAAWALAAAAVEGMQYICSRSIVDSIFEFRENFMQHPMVFAAIGLKVICILLILHFQQLGLAGDLSRFAAIYLACCTLFICAYGVAFFGDKMPLSFAFAASALFTVGGIWLLNQADDTGSSKDDLVRTNDGAEEGVPSGASTWRSAEDGGGSDRSVRDAKITN